MIRQGNEKANSEKQCKNIDAQSTVTHKCVWQVPWAFPFVKPKMLAGAVGIRQQRAIDVPAELFESVAVHPNQSLPAGVAFGPEGRHFEAVIRCAVNQLELRHTCGLETTAFSPTQNLLSWQQFCVLEQFALRCVLDAQLFPRLLLSGLQAGFSGKISSECQLPHGSVQRDTPRGADTGHPRKRLAVSRERHDEREH